LILFIYSLFWSVFIALLLVLSKIFFFFLFFEISSKEYKLEYLEFSILNTSLPFYYIYLHIYMLNKLHSFSVKISLFEQYKREGVMFQLFFTLCGCSTPWHQLSLAGCTRFYRQTKRIILGFYIDWNTFLIWTNISI